MMRRGDQLFQSGRFAEALATFERAIPLTANASILHFKTAFSAWRAGRQDMVEPHLRAAIASPPPFAPAHDLLGQWYLFQAKYDQALEQSSIACRMEPANPEFQLSRAYILAGIGEMEAAWQLLEPRLHDPLTVERATMLYLRVASWIGREAQAVAQATRHLQTATVVPVERPAMLFALSALLDRLGRHDEAFERARQARTMLNVPYDSAVVTRETDRSIRLFTAETLRSMPRLSAAEGIRPVFIVGMPRSGTSLTEQILASHPSVCGGGEIEELPRIVAGLDAALDARTLTRERIEAAAAEYLRTLRSPAPAGGCVTDKLPLNFRHLGWIQLLFPNAAIIHCVRDPLDTCVSCYMTDFAAGVGFCRSPADLGAYWRDYRRLMDHWRTNLSLPMLEIRYEEVVADLEGRTRDMLRFLDLPWDDRCLRFHENRRAVQSASRDQVRRPLYSSSVGRGRNYARFLPDLVAALH